MYENNDNQPWKVKDLIAALQKHDPEALISVPIETYTQAYPSGYFSLSWVQKTNDGVVRLWVHLGKGWIVSKRRK